MSLTSYNLKQAIKWEHAVSPKPTAIEYLLADDQQKEMTYFSYLSFQLLSPESHLFQYSVWKKR